MIVLDFWKRASDRTEKFLRDFTNSVVKSILHLLAFNSDYFQYFTQSGEHYRQQPYQISEGVIYLLTPNLVEEASQYYKCAGLSYYIGKVYPHEAIDNEFYWDDELLQNEIMATNEFFEDFYFSNLTLSFLRDTGWYEYLNSSMVRDYGWGRNRGCSFFFKDCKAVEYQGHSEFCVPQSQQQDQPNNLDNDFYCTYDKTAKGYCTRLVAWHSCYEIFPIYVNNQFKVDCQGGYEGNMSYYYYSVETISQSSRCFKSNILHSTKDSAVLIQDISQRCFSYQCIPGNSAQAFRLKIFMNEDPNNYLVCDETNLGMDITFQEDQGGNPSQYKGYLRCPQNTDSYCSQASRDTGSCRQKTCGMRGICVNGECHCLNSYGSMCQHSCLENCEKCTGEAQCSLCR